MQYKRNANSLEGKWSCFATHISYKVCGLTQTLAAASKGSHQDLSLRKGRKERTKRRQKEERREEARQRSTVKAYRASPYGKSKCFPSLETGVQIRDRKTMVIRLTT